MVKIDIDHLEKYFVKSDLIPAIAFDVDTKTVLMLAYMNAESLRKTLETGYTWYWSRSRQELWNKGATSGHLQKVVSIYSDCDDDTLLLNVKQTGAACHTGSYSCFFNEMYREDEKNECITGIVRGCTQPQGDV
ncbi:MAG: phosphoribosyl-AMP cyclohydrolase [Ruminococcus sp.]|nr:phosphoribosyl-AMP cyclohydrolase [Ruminococcus sp.]